MAVLLTPMPDVEMALLYALVPMEPSIRFVTAMPAGDLPQITCRIRRVSGGSGSGHGAFWIDRPIVDIDVWGQVGNATAMDVSIAARNIEADIMSLMGIKVLNGVIQHVLTVSGPKTVPEANPNLTRNNATYEVRIHP